MSVSASLVSAALRGRPADLEDQWVEREEPGGGIPRLRLPVSTVCTTLLCGGGGGGRGGGGLSRDFSFVMTLPLLLCLDAVVSPSPVIQYALYLPYSSGLSIELYSIMCVSDSSLVMRSRGTRNASWQLLPSGNGHGMCHSFA